MTRAARLNPTAVGRAERRARERAYRAALSVKRRQLDLRRTRLVARVLRAERKAARWWMRARRAEAA